VRRRSGERGCGENRGGEDGGGEGGGGKGSGDGLGRATVGSAADEEVEVVVRAAELRVAAGSAVARVANWRTGDGGGGL